MNIKKKSFGAYFTLAQLVYIKKHNHAQGFTLIELLVALVIFSIMGTIVSFALQHTFITRAQIKRYRQDLMDLQLLHAHLAQDFAHLSREKIYTAKYHTLGNFWGTSDQLKFIRTTTFENNTQLPELRLIHYKKKGIQLIRQSSLLDKAPIEQRILLNSLTQYQIHYLDKQKHFLSVWQTSGTPRLPRAILIEFNLKKHGHIRWLFKIF